MLDLRPHREHLDAGARPGTQEARHQEQGGETGGEGSGEPAADAPPPPVSMIEQDPPARQGEQHGDRQHQRHRMAEVGPEDQRGEGGGPPRPHPFRPPQPEADREEEDWQAEAEVEEPHVEHEVVDEGKGEDGEETGLRADPPQGVAHRDGKEHDVGGEQELLGQGNREEGERPALQEEEEPVGQRLVVEPIVLAEQPRPGVAVLAQDEGDRLVVRAVLAGKEGEGPERQHVERQQPPEEEALGGGPAAVPLPRESRKRRRARCTTRALPAASGPKATPTVSPSRQVMPPSTWRMAGSASRPRRKRTWPPTCQSSGMPERPTPPSERFSSLTARRVPSGSSTTASTPSRMRTSRCPASPSRAEMFMPWRRITSARSLSSRPGLAPRIVTRAGLAMRSRTVGAAVRAEA